MRRILLLAVLSLFGVRAHAQSGFTTASALPVLDPNSSPYVGCKVSASFVPAPNATQVPTIGGSTFQTDVPGIACDSFGNFSVVLADNNLVQDGHASGPSSMWRFAINSQDGKTGFQCTVFITGNTQNITAPIQACAAPLPPSSGGGSGPYVFKTVTPCASTMTFAMGGVSPNTANTIFSVPLTCNVASTSVTGNPKPGSIAQFVLTQDAVGSRSFVFPTNFLNPPSVQQAALAETDAAFQFDGTFWHPIVFPASGGGSATPGGTNLQGQYNNTGTLGGTSCYNLGTTAGPLNFDCDTHPKGPNPSYDITRYGAYSSGLNPPSITCATTATLNTMVCGGGVSDFLIGHGVSVQLAGPAGTLPAPGAAIPLTAVSISSNVGTITTTPLESFASGSSITIAGASDSALNGTFTIIANGNTQFNITHANCSPCSVGGSATVVAVVPGTVTSQGILNGTTNYSYKVVARDKNGGLSPASAAFTTTTGPATLGVNNGPTLSSCNRTSGLVTCTTSSAHNFQAGVPVNIPRGSGDPAFEGQFTIVSTPLSTTFTFYEAGQADRTGTVTPGAVTPQVVAKNIVKWVMQPYGQYQAFIYRCTGVACSNYTLIGITEGMDSAFEDWGFGLSGPTPAYISTTIPTAVAVNAPLNTTITAINGSTITLAATATTSVGSATVLHDNGPNLLLACNAGKGTIYFPNNSSSYLFSSILDLAPCSASNIETASSIFINDPWLVKNNISIIGKATSGGCAPSSSLDFCAPIGGFAYPFFLLTPGAAGTNSFKNLSMSCLQTYQSCIFYDQDNNGNNVSAQYFHQMNFRGGNSLPLKFGGAFDYFWDYGTLFNNTIVGNWGVPPALASQANQGFGNVAQQLLSDFQVRNLTVGDGEWLWDDKGQTGAGAGIIGNNRFIYLVNESSHTPQFRFNTSTSQIFLANWTLDTDQYADPLGGQAVPIIDFTNVTSGRLASFNVYGQGCSGGNQPIVAIAPGTSGVFFQGNTVSCSIVGSDTFIARNPALDIYKNSNVNFTGTGQVGYTLAQPAAPSVSNVAGTLAAGTYFYLIIPVDVNLNPGPSPSPVSASCTSNGSQACVVSFTPVNGQAFTILCRGPAANNTPCAIVGTAHNFSGSSFTDNLGAGNFSNSVGLAVGNGSGSSLGSGGVATSVISLVGGGFQSTITGIFTANRAQSVPDASGTFAVSATAPVVLSAAGGISCPNCFNLSLNNNVGTHFIDIGTQASPGNPGAGNIRIYGDSGSGNLTCLTSAGANCIPGGGGGTPGGSNTQVQFNSSGSFAGNANLTWVSPALSVGVAAGATGQVKFVGTTSGTVTTQSQDAAGTWTFKWPTNAGSANFPMITDGSGNASWALLPVAGGGTGSTALTASQIVYSTGSSLSTMGASTVNVLGSATQLTLKPGLATGTALALDTAASPTGDILDINVNGSKTSWFDNAGLLHTPTATYTGSGALTLSGTESACPAPASGIDIFCLGDLVSHTAQLSLNGAPMKSVLVSVNTNPIAHGVAMYGSTFPQMTSSGAGSAGAPFLSGGASADGTYGALNLAGGASILSGILPTVSGGTGSSSLSGANIVTVSGAVTVGHCTSFAASTVVQDAGAACGGGSAPARLDQITAATGSATINNATNPIGWNWGLTGSTTGFKLSEPSAGTGAGNILFQATTLNTSTDAIAQFDNNGNGVTFNSTGFATSKGTGGVDSNLLHCDANTTTKCMQFVLSGITAATTRNKTWTDTAGTVAESANTVTFTNKTQDAEGTGNVLTRPFYWEFTPACNNATADQGSFDVPTSAATTFSCSGTTTTLGNADFVDGSTTGLTAHATLPDSWTGNVDVSIEWWANASSANAVRWSVATGCVASGAAVSTGPSYNTASATNAAYTGTALQLQVTTQTAVAVTNCASGNPMWIQVQRIGGDAGDTLTATAELISLKVKGRFTK